MNKTRLRAISNENDRSSVLKFYPKSKASVHFCSKSDTVSQFVFNDEMPRIVKEKKIDHNFTLL